MLDVRIKRQISESETLIGPIGHSIMQHENDGHGLNENYGGGTWHKKISLNGQNYIIPCHLRS